MVVYKRLNITNSMKNGSYYKIMLIVLKNLYNFIYNSIFM